MKRSFVLILAVQLVTSSSNMPAAEFVEIGADLAASRLSADGRVVVGQTPLAIQEGSQAYIWSRETGIRTLGTLPNADMSRARDVSADGTVVVGYSRRITGVGTGFDEPFVWTNENGMVGLGQLPGFTDANVWDWMNVSEDGSTVVGTFNYPVWSAFRWTKEEGLVGLMPPGKSFSTASAVSADGRVVVGNASTLPPSASRREDGFIWDKDNGYRTLEPKPRGWNRIFPWLVSADGKIVFGEDFSIDPLGRPFLWTAEQGIQPLPGESMRIDHLRDITPDGSILVGSAMEQDGAGPNWAFVWDQQNGTRDLRDVLISEHGFADEQLPTLSIATGISADAKTIVGSTELSEIRWAIYLDKPLVSPFGDLNDDHYRDAADIDLLSQAIRDTSVDDRWDLNSDGGVTDSDRVYWVHEIADTYFGDANLDGTFNNLDLVEVLQSGEYNDDILRNSTWSTGDWNGDTEFDELDIVLALQDGGYGQGALSAVSAVPEPTAAGLLLSGMILLVCRWRRPRR